MRLLLHGRPAKTYVKEDPGEKVDLLGAHGESAVRLHSLLAKWQLDVRSER